MTFTGWQRLSLIDYPGKVAAVVFTAGCNLRCPFCHNPELVTGAPAESFTGDEVLAHLHARRGRLDGLVVTGGEPLLHAGLPAFLRRVREAGFLVKLDTNGTLPGPLAAVLDERLADFVAMDIKAPPDKYARLAGTAVDPAAIRESIRLIRNAGIDHLFRTTAVRPLLTADDLREIAAWLEDPGHYRLQPFVRTVVLDPELPGCPQWSEAELAEILSHPA